MARKPTVETEIELIKQDIHTIKNNHLSHIEDDISLLRTKMDKVDNRIWWVLGLLVASSVVGMIGEIL